MNTAQTFMLALALGIAFAIGIDVHRIADAQKTNSAKEDAYYADVKRMADAIERAAAAQEGALNNQNNE